MIIAYKICIGLTAFGIILAMFSLIVGAAGSRHTDDFYNGACLVGCLLAFVFGMFSLGLKLGGAA